MYSAKRAGFSDQQIADQVKSTEAQVRDQRKVGLLVPLLPLLPLLV